VDQIISPFILYGMIALGAIGVGLALPKRGQTPQVIGGLLAALAAGGIILGLTLKATEARPNLFFYVFGVIALGAALRVVTHSRPVYAALWFIMVVLASAGMLLILSAEFMAFALIIVYAGAILITYLFVIMLATQAPADDTMEVLESKLRDRDLIVAGERVVSVNLADK
jgi:NADH-quinone oxidoreductase subunit J